MLVICQELGGFLTGLEIVQRLGAELQQCESLLILAETGIQDKNVDPHEIVHTVLDATTTNAVISSTVLEILDGLSVVDDLIPTPAVRLVRHGCNIPPPPQLLVRLLRYMDMNVADIPIDELGSDISRDPHATAELLRVTNNSQLGPRSEVRRAADAVTLLGPKQAISRIFSSAVIAQSTNMTGVSPEFRNWYQRRCVLIASTASVFAERLERIAPDLAFTMGMLQDIGMMIMHLRAGSRYSALIHRFRTLGAAHIVKLEMEDYNFTHADAGAALLREWGIPATIIGPVLDHHQDGMTNDRSAESAFRRVMAIGEAVANVNDMKHSSRLRRLNECLNYYGPAKAELCRAAMQDAAVKSADACKMFSVPA
ncbi:MAG: HDOD domain-containing protein, partial [Planctomycetota bacterium]|nr:HDOD domain-containing protein [Planctomycetota bacterium]